MDLLKQLEKTMGKAKVVNLSRILQEQHYDIRELIDLTFYHEPKIGFRAAWVLEHTLLQHPEMYVDHLDYLISRIPEVINPSCKRHYAKIVMHLTSRRAASAIQQKLQHLNLEPVVEQCFDWMIDPQVLVAVKVHAAEALYHMQYRYPWISEELANQLKFLMRNGSAAIQSRGKKLLTPSPLKGSGKVKGFQLSNDKS